MIKPYKEMQVGGVGDPSRTLGTWLIENGYAVDASDHPGETIPEKPKEETIVHVIHHHTEDMGEEE